MKDLSSEVRTVTVELRHSNALKLLRELELTNIIRILDKGQKQNNNRPPSSLRGSISKQRAKELNQEVKRMREEWDERGI